MSNSVVMGPDASRAGSFSVAARERGFVSYDTERGGGGFGQNSQSGLPPSAGASRIERMVARIESG